MEYIALCASLFLKNALISERKFVTLCTGIGLSFLLFCHYKDTHFLQQTEIPMPFLCTNTSYYCQLAKLEYIQIIIGAKAGVRTLAFFHVLRVYDCINTVSRTGLHGSKRFLRNRVMAVRRLLKGQKTVYDLKLLVIFLKKSVMFFKKLVMFYQSLAAPCCFPVY